MPASSVLVTLCTYNEREILSELIREIHSVAPQVDILVIDDNSPDGTGRLADEMAEADPRIHVLHRAGKLGLGTATLAGFQYAIEHDYELLVNMDADFSHHPRYLPSLIDGMQNADVVIGSRYVAGGGVEGWTFLRHFMSSGINWYARLLLGLKTRDNSGAFRAYRVAKLREIPQEKVRARGYAFQEEILYRLRRVGCRFAEVPIIFENRRHGSSKINSKEALVALWVIFRLGVENLFSTRSQESGVSSQV
ncbi:MAG: polyprenol monophosphomannose synthase [Planctomycetaceae bacterium]